MSKLVQEKFANVVCLHDTNHRQAKTHESKPDKKTGEKADSFVFDAMLKSALAGEQPWSEMHPGFAVTAETFRKLFAKLRPDWCDKIGKAKLAVMAGHCRIEDLIRIAELTGQKVGDYVIPFHVVEPTSAAEFFAMQLEDNVAIGQGVKRVSALEVFRFMDRQIHDYSVAEPVKESEVKDMTKTERGVYRRCWAQWLVCSLCNDGFDRFNMSRDKGDDGKVYSPTGWIPFVSSNYDLLSQVTDAADDWLGLRKSSSEASPAKRKVLAVGLEKSRQRASSDIEKLVKSWVEGSVAKPVKPVTKQQINDCGQLAPVDSLGESLVDSLRDGSQFKAFFATWRTLLGLTLREAAVLQQQVADAADAKIDKVAKVKVDKAKVDVEMVDVEMVDVEMVDA